MGGGVGGGWGGVGGGGGGRWGWGGRWGGVVGGLPPLPTHPPLRFTREQTRVEYIRRCRLIITFLTITASSEPGIPRLLHRYINTVTGMWDRSAEDRIRYIAVGQKYFSAIFHCYKIVTHNVKDGIEIETHDVQDSIDIVDTIFDMMCYKVDTVLNMMCYVLAIMDCNVDTKLDILNCRGTFRYNLAKRPTAPPCNHQFDSSLCTGQLLRKTRQT